MSHTESGTTKRVAATVVTVVVAVILLILVLFFLLTSSATLHLMTTTSSNDIGLMFLGIFGSLSPVFACLMLFFAVLSFVYAVKEYRKESKEDNSQVLRFVIVGCAFIVAALMVWIFSRGVPLAIF